MQVDAVGTAFDQAADTIDGSYALGDAWLAMARLNSGFRDAHVGLRLPDTAYAEAVARGAKPFPMEVRVANGRIFLADIPTTEILSINNISADKLTAALTPRMRGESRSLQERVLSLRFPVALWVMLGDQSEYTVELQDKDGRLTRKLLAERGPAPDREPAKFDLNLVGDTAILTVDTFDIALADEFRGFLEQAFASIADADAVRLLIDVRENGGGARELSDQLLAYLTAERYTPISAVIARVTPENQALIPGSTLGQVVQMPFAQWVTPPQELDHRFKGRVGILIGPATYSQAIVFAATAKDIGVATLLGAPTEGLANQTGQVQRHTLQNTGFEVQAPLYVFTRPSGEIDTAPLQPMIPLRGDTAEQLDAALQADWSIEADG